MFLAILLLQDPDGNLVSPLGNVWRRWRYIRGLSRQYVSLRVVKNHGVLVIEMQERAICLPRMPSQGKFISLWIRMFSSRISTSHFKINQVINFHESMFSSEWSNIMQFCESKWQNGPFAVLACLRREGTFHQEYVCFLMFLFIIFLQNPDGNLVSPLGNVWRR